MSLVSKSDTGSDFANFSYRSSLPCRAHSASCRGCASVNKIENFARLPVRVHHILSIFSHQDKSQPQLSHFQFLDAAQTGTRAQRQPGDKQDKQDFQFFFDTAQTQTQTTRQTRLPVFRRSSDTDPRPETSRRRGEQTRLVFQRQLRGLWVLLTQSFHINQYSAGLPSGAYKFSDVGETSAEPESAKIFKKDYLVTKIANSVRHCCYLIVLQWKLHSGIHRLAPTE